MKVMWHEHAWPEIVELIGRDPVAVLPVGAIEQHGPHLPLGVDTMLCTEVARRATERALEAGAAAVLLPTVWSGYSPHHMDFRGTLTVTADTLQRLVIDLVRSLHHHGVRRILILNGHGGNAHHLRAVVQTLRFEHGIETVTASYWDFGREAIGAWRRSPLGGINHACEMETSLMLVARPDLVDMGAAADVMLPPRPYFSGDLTEGGAAVGARTFAEVTETGVIGAPSLADATRGAALLDDLVAAVAGFIVSYARGGGASA
jgi:creatinine amidohydrolase